MILRAQNFAQNRPPYAEFGVLRRIEENFPNGAENAKTLLIFLTLLLTTVKIAQYTTRC